ncbi:MAG TPA: hypothetical protein VM513_10380 [Kofleriaceae bacterium]|nr:hypothetical protein [Kofleriaceae bacterium]
MRATMLLVALTAACTPDIVSGAYLCGPEKACPDDQVCDGVDNLCVLSSQARPYTCSGAPLPAQPATLCATVPVELSGCIGDGDTDSDTLEVAVPAACVTSSVNVRLSFPLAYAPLQMTLVDAGTGAMVAADGPCAGDADDDGDVRRCLEANVAADQSYRISVAPTGEDNCGGACDYNRYRLTFQLLSRGAR